MKKLIQATTLLIVAIFLQPVNSVISVPHLLSNMLNDAHLISCEVIFVSITGPEVNSFAVSSTDTIDPVMLPSYDTTKSSSGTFSVVQGGVFDTNKTSVINFRRLKDIHPRFNSKHCGVAVLYISHVTPHLPKWLFDTIVPRYVPLIRKDEDYFLFVFSSESDADEMLLSPEFGLKIRFKVGIVYSSNAITREDNQLPQIKQVGPYAENGKCTVNTIGLPHSSDVKSLFLDKKNFNGKRFRVVTPKAPSYFEMERDGQGNTYRPVRGLYKVWLDVMIEHFNFSIHLTMSSASGSTGKRLKNGTWVGSVGDILAGRADMASFNGHIYNRHEYVDWSAPLTYEWMVFITHKPRSFFSPSAIYRPFPIILWVGFIASVLLICIVLKLIVKLVYWTEIPLHLNGMIMYIVSTFMEQDGEVYLQVLQLHSVRILVAFWLLFALIISTAYRGKLVSLIAFPARTWIPTTFDELAYSNYRVGLNVFGKGGATYSVLSTSKSPVYQTFFQRMELFPDPVRCLSAAFHHDLGCLMVKSVADFFGAKNFTDKFGRNPFQPSEETALFREDGYIWEKRAVFRKHFDRVTWSMMETGLSNFWFQQDLYNVKKKRLDWERLNGRNSTLEIQKEDDGPAALVVAHFMGVFYLYVCGVGIGTIALIWERVHRHHRYKAILTRLKMIIHKTPIFI